MKKKIFLISLIILILIVGLFILTGCGNNETDKENVASNESTSNPIVGEYELQEVIDDTGTITAEEWKSSRGSDETMIIDSNNTATKISSYGKNTTMTHDYTYDDKYFYDKGKIAYSYEYVDGTIRLTDLRYEDVERAEIYKKK